ncbi:MAG: DoxX family protein [Cyclobacteriaceae bacterium]
MAAASETMGGLLLALRLKTRLASFLIICIMLVAIIFQKWDQGTWGMLPAMGFLWVGLYSLVLGSGRFGLDIATDGGIRPDVTVQKTWEDLVKGVDTEVEAVMSLIEE